MNKKTKEEILGSRPKTLAGWWQNYFVLVVNPDAGEAQKADTKNAFYAGASAIMEVIITGNELSQKEFGEKMEAIALELEEYAKKLIDKEANLIN